MKHIQLFLMLCTVLIASVSQAATEKTTYFHNDALGSPIAATDGDGKLLWTESYKPYGERLEKNDGNETGMFYTGKHEEKDIGLSYFGARWYDPVAGRFTGIDPVGFDAGNVHSFNRYAYANGNPYKFVDPDGNSPVHAAKFLADVGLNLTLNYMTTGQFQTGAAFKEAIEGLANPFKSIDKVKKLDKLLSLKDQAKKLKHTLNKNKNSVTIQTPNKKIHYDLDGATHKGVPTPHKQISEKNTNPKTGETFWNKDRKNVDKMTQQDMRTARKFLEKQSK